MHAWTLKLFSWLLILCQCMWAHSILVTFHFTGSSQEFHSVQIYIRRCRLCAFARRIVYPGFRNAVSSDQDSSLTMKCPKGISQVSRSWRVRYPTLGSEPRPLRYSSHLYLPYRTRAGVLPSDTREPMPVTHQLSIPSSVSYAHDAWFMTFTFTSHTRHFKSQATLGILNHKPH